MQQIYPAQGAFAAVRHDGSVVSWGSQSGGGDASLVQNRLREVGVKVGVSHAYDMIEYNRIGYIIV